MRQDDRRLDVALGALLVAQEDQPELDVERVLDRVEDLASRLRDQVRRRSPAGKLAALNRFFFDELGFAAASVRTSRYGEDRLADLLLPHVLRRRQGHCVGLSSAYLALGYRADLPLFGVSAPGHFFVRWEGPGLRQNVELTARGVAHTDDYYVKRFGIRPELVDRGVYLQNLRRREVLAEILNNRANFYWDRGDELRAIRDLDRIVQVSHNFSRAYVGRGFAALHRGDLDTAERDLTKALDIDPSDSRALLLLGQVHLRRGFLDRAQEVLLQATEEDHRNALAATWLGRLYEIRGEHDRAVEWHERAIRIDGRCHTAWNHLGLTRQAIGELDRARDAFQEARRLAPGNLRAKEYLVLLTRGEYDRIAWTARPAFRAVCADYERRLRESPDSNAIRSAYVRFLLGTGLRLQRALKLARQVATRAETTHNVETLARLLWLTGDLPKAEAQLERALEIDAERGGAEQRRLEGLLGQLRQELR